MNDWCKGKGAGGWMEYSRTHKYKHYQTFFLKREMYYCIKCGKKIVPEEFEEYIKYNTALNKAMEEYYDKEV